MVEDTIQIKYPVEKLIRDEFNRNKSEEENGYVTIEYVIRSEEKGKTSDFLLKVNGLFQEKNNNDSLESVDLIANEVLSFDTCFRLFLELQKTKFEITSRVDYIGESYTLICDFINNAEETICSINYYNEEKVSPRQVYNNSILENFITQHKNTWSLINSGEVYGYLLLEEMELDGEDRKKMEILLERLKNYSLSYNHRSAPYHIYEQMAAVVDKDFYYKRRLLTTLHRVLPDSVKYSKLFTCFVLDVENFRTYIKKCKEYFIGFMEKLINNYLSAGISETDLTVVEIVRKYLKQESNTKYHKRYGWSYKKPKGCVGLLISSKEKFFAFSGYQDVKDLTLRANIPGAHDKLSDLIKTIENALSKYYFKSEVTNNDERYYDKNASTYYNLQKDLPLNDRTKKRYQCVEKKLFSHVYKNFTLNDDIIVITTFPPCKQRGCQDLIGEYKKMCKSIRTFCIGDYNTGKIVEFTF